MNGINKVQLMGNLGNNPEFRFTKTEKEVCNFTVATNESGRETPEWHRIVTWGKLAKACADHLSKGRQVFIEGRLQTRKWNDREGNLRYTTEIVAHQVKFLGKREVQQTENVPTVSVSAAELFGDNQ